MPPRDTVVFYISGHGFGHASRQIEIINALAALQPDLRVVVRTSAPQWLFDLGLRRPFSFDDTVSDTGVVQVNSLAIDATASIGCAWDFHRSPSPPRRWPTCRLSRSATSPGIASMSTTSSRWPPPLI
jgi:hypothetical protein